MKYQQQLKKAKYVTVYMHNSWLTADLSPFTVISPVENLPKKQAAV